MARANPRGTASGTPAGIMPLAKLRADEQEQHTRRRPEASWHKTTKPCDLTATVKDGAALRQQCSDSACPCLGRSDVSGSAQRAIGQLPVRPLVDQAWAHPLPSAVASERGGHR